MKTLSIHQPYANLIMIGEKEWEYRSWITDYRGDLLICSTKKPIISHYAYLYGHAFEINGDIFND